jgi:hypothetical protein
MYLFSEAYITHSSDFLRNEKGAFLKNGYLISSTAAEADYKSFRKLLAVHSFFE